MINTRCEYPLDQLQECLDIDPHTFHGGDPAQNGYFFFAFLELPPPESDVSSASVQMTFTWPYESGYLGEEKPSDPPDQHLERLAWLKRIAQDWANPVGELIKSMPVDSTLLPVTIAEWLPSDGFPRKPNGRVTVVGDSAHLMTSFRGEGANHGVVDVANLIALLNASGTDAADIGEVVSKHEKEMIKRTRPATFNARQACIDANHYSSVKLGSPYLARRAILTEE
ncbi:MAG: hypothetical protein Q9204_007592 [Flavoplaca sp. TL-2023a]